MVKLNVIASGEIGLLHRAEEPVQRFANFELRESPPLARDEPLQRKLYDARMEHRGNLTGSGAVIGPDKVLGWDSFGRDKRILLDAYQPQRLPSDYGDWVLVLENNK